MKVSELRNRCPTVGFWAISALLLAALAASWATASAEETSVANSSESWRERGDELWADGSLEEALEAYDKSLLIDPENGDVWLGKALILDILGNTSESQEAYREAVDAFDEDLKVDPEDAQSWWGMGVALDSLGRREEATEAREKAAFIFNQTLEENPDDAETWFDMAEVLVGLLRREEAIEAYGKAIELNSTKADYAAISQGVLLQELGRYDESLVAFDRAIELIPEYDAQMLATVWYHKANSLDNNNRPKEALEAYDVVTELDPGNKGAWLGKGTMLEDLGMYDQSLEAFATALKLDPQLFYAWTKKGDLLIKLGQNSEAQTAYAEALEICDLEIKKDPHDYGAWRNKGVALYKMGEFEEAIEAYNESIENSPPDFTVSYALVGKADSLRALGMNEEALAAYREAIELYPLDPEAWQGKGEAELSLGRRIEADHAFNMAEKLGYQG